MSFLTAIRTREPAILRALALAILLAATAYLVQGNIGLNLQDEGFLWYGALATAAGEVPMHDFRAYDPGRYYWCAAWTSLFGPGPLALRAACWGFAAVGIFFGLLAAARVVKSTWSLALVGILFVVWMFPPWKLFECAIALIAVYSATLLVESPTLRTHALAGAVTGLAAFFGRNHGLYLVVAQSALIAFLWWKHGRESYLRRAGAWIGGIVAGYAPMLCLMIFVPGFARTFVDSILFYTRQSSLNVPLPIPWPWLADYSSLDALNAIFVFSVGTMFLLVPLVYAIAWIVSLRAPVAELGPRALLIGSVFVGSVYVHHASVRSDIYHLAQAIHPWILCAFAAGAWAWTTRAKWLAAASMLVVLALSIGSIGLMQPWSSRHLAAGTPAAFVPLEVRGDEISIDPNTGGFVRTMSALVARLVPVGDDVWFPAQLISFYPILDRHSPVWDTYPAWNASADLEQRMLHELDDIEWIVTWDEPIGGAVSMRFANLYPKVWGRMQSEFERVRAPELGAPMALLHKKRS